LTTLDTSRLQLGKALDFGVLGPLLVTRPEGPIELKADKQRALLAVLLLAYREESVSPARLVDELWGDDPPATAAKAVQVHLSRLRSALGSEQPIITRPSGYAVRIEPDQLDLARFEALSERARTARREGDLPTAAALWREALALFRGSPLADVPLLGVAASEVSRLAELELTGLDERIAVELELGEHVALVAELQALVAEHPYRERLHAQLMLALYRSGRQAEALEAFRHARRTLVEELGLEPSRELQQLESAVLAQDPVLDLLLSEPPRPRRVAVPPLPVPVAATSSASAAARRVLPAPSAPVTATSAPPPAAHSARRRPSSSARPASGGAAAASSSGGSRAAGRARASDGSWRRIASWRSRSAGSGSTPIVSTSAARAAR